MPNSFERQTISFVVRVWAEPGASSHPQWRAQIEHVPSGEQVHIQISAALRDFLVTHLVAAEPLWAQPASAVRAVQE